MQGERVDDDLVGQAPQALAVERLVMGEMLAERPVLVEQRHADRGIGVEHLLGRDHLDLVRIDVEPQFADARSPRRRRGCAGASRNPSRRPRRGSSVEAAVMTRPSRCPCTALEQLVEHRKDLAAVADLAHRQAARLRRAGARRAPQRRVWHAEAIVRRPRRPRDRRNTGRPAGSRRSSSRPVSVAVRVELSPSEAWAA